MRLTLCTLFNMNYHFLNTYYYCVHFSNYIVLFLSLLHKDARQETPETRTHALPRDMRMRAGAHRHTHSRMSL